MSAPLLALTSSSTGKPWMALTVTDSGCGPSTSASARSASTLTAALVCSVSSKSPGEVSTPPK
jgi:hypothetical protein